MKDKELPANTPTIYQFNAKKCGIKRLKVPWDKHWIIIRITFACGGNGLHEYLWPDLKWRSYSIFDTHLDQPEKGEKNWKEGKHAWLKTRDDAITLLTKWQETQKDIPPFLKGEDRCNLN